MLRMVITRHYYGEKNHPFPPSFFFQCSGCRFDLSVRDSNPKSMALNYRTWSPRDIYVCKQFNGFVAACDFVLNLEEIASGACMFARRKTGGSIKEVVGP